MKLLLVIAAVVAMGEAHLCLLSPQQRGNITGLDMAGSVNCLLVKDAPCGGRMEEMPMTTFMAGKNATIIFQKNLDHWDKAMPGRFEINFWAHVGVKMQTLMMIPDTGTPSGYIYTVNVPMPDIEAENAILQVVYVTNNPMAPAMFYQCADVRVMKMK